MANCLDCDKKNKEIVDLKGLVDFHKGEEKAWRILYEEKRGGEVFNKLQKEYADIVIENTKLRMELKKEEQS